MMKVFAFIAVATFLVVDTSATIPSVGGAESWEPQCRNESGFSESIALDANFTTQREFLCFSACMLEKAGFIKDGQLAEREKAVADLAQSWSSDLGALGVQPKEGTTYRQLAEKCYDEANVKTDKCEIGGAMATCLNEGTE